MIYGVVYLGWQGETRLRQAYVAANRLIFLDLYPGAPKRSDGGSPANGARNKTRPVPDW